MSKIIDLRSDTVTKPTPEMLEAMFHAEVGDDVYGEDPTVKQLQNMAAEITGKEAAIFVPSGTMGNQLSLFTHSLPSNEVILGNDCHIVEHEAGAAALISNVQLRCIPTVNGMMDIQSVRSTIRGEFDIHYPKTSLICVENAHSCGVVHPLSYMSEIYSIAKEHEIPVHLDGARLFNAAAYLGVKASEITQYCDTVMFCISKGLCAPIGSLLCGSREFIEKSRRKRKILGGAMRQVGYLAAAGVYALEHMVNRVDDDHINAKNLSKLLAEIPGVNAKPEDVQINMVFFSLKSKNPEALVTSLREYGIVTNPPEHGIIRMVTHYWISKEDIIKTAEIVGKLVMEESN